MNFRTFFAVLVIGIVFLAWLQSPPDVRPFEANNEAVLSLLDTLPGKDVAALKVNHASRTGPVAVGVFGNSRSIQLSTANMGLEDGKFFNFSVPGSSCRQSIVMLEALAEARRLPHTVVLSLDNLNLQYYGNPAFPMAPRRWQWAFHDVLYGLQASDIDLVAVAKMVKRHALIEWLALIDTFNAKILKARISLRWGLTNNSLAAPYRSDGSRIMEEVRQPVIKANLPQARPNIIAGYLAYDLARLARIEATGTKVIVYETPLFQGVKGSETRAIKVMRRHLQKTCKDLSLACYLAPVLPDIAKWGDVSHAPAAALGPWVSRLIMRNARDAQ